MKIPEAKAAVDIGEIKEHFIVECEESEIKARSHPSDEERRSNRSPREFDGPLSSEERRTCKTPPQINERVVLWEDNVKDEEGYRAVCTEQVASASQMAAAQFLDTISKIPGMAAETSDAIPAHTQVKINDAPSLLRLPMEECLEI